MTSAQQDTQTAAPANRLTALRSNCMGAAVLCIIEFGVGAAVSLYVTVPAHESFFPAVFGSALLATHAVLAILLLGAAIGAVARSIRARAGIVLTSAGLAGVLVAELTGAAFVGNSSNGASLAMALATVAAMFCYLAAVFSLR